MVSKDGTTLSQQLQCIMLHITQYNLCILYKPGPDLYIANWLSSHIHTENKDQEIAGMSLSIQTLSKVIDILACISIEDITNTMSIDAELQMHSKRLTAEKR